MEDGQTEEREYRERDNDEHKLMLKVVRQNLSWTIHNLTLPSESFCGRGRGTPLKFELQAGLPPKSNLVRDLTFKKTKDAEKVWHVRMMSIDMWLC